MSKRTYQPKKIRRRRHGFRARQGKPSGRLILARRRQKRRHRLTVD